jgi:hypothetical protein
LEIVRDLLLTGTERQIARPVHADPGVRFRAD